MKFTDTDNGEADLWEFETRQSDDSVKQDLELIHITCGTHICDVEPDDVLAVLVSVCVDHYRECGTAGEETTGG